MPIVEITNAHSFRILPRARMNRLVECILQEEKRSGKSWISVVALSDRAIRQINRRFLGHDYATDCLSFLLSDDQKCIEGEVYISLDHAYRQSREYGVSYFNEVLRLTAHGCLHLCGYEDYSRRKRQEMLSIGERYLQALS